MRRMGHQPGELNHYFYQPRGLVLALASSRHPLTSACTMVGAALAAGNPVVLKPGSRARESSACLAQLLVRAGFPADAVGFLPVAGDRARRRLGRPSRRRPHRLHRHAPVALRVAEVAGRRGTGASASSASSPTSTAPPRGVRTRPTSSSTWSPGSSPRTHCAAASPHPKSCSTHAMSRDGTGAPCRAAGTRRCLLRTSWTWSGARPGEWTEGRRGRLNELLESPPLRELAAEDARFRAIVGVSFDAYYDWDIRTGDNYFSEHFDDMLGQPRGLGATLVLRMAGARAR